MLGEPAAPKEPEAEPGNEPKTTEEINAEEEFEEFEINFPDETHLTDDQIGEIEALVEKHGMTAEQAQAYVDNIHTQYQMGVNSAKAQTNAQYKKDMEIIAKMPEFATPEKKAETLEQVGRVREYLNDPELNQLLSSEVGSNPALVRAFIKIGKAMSGELPPMGKPPAPAPKEISVAQKLYPSLFKDQ